jgi:post-segregation antitoxin (ccd killing protein)
MAMPTSERVTITLPAKLLHEVDQLERNRSRFISEAVQHEVARRRRAALLESVQSPHPETTQFVDGGLTDWTSELPDDEGLLDSSAGTAVRWVEGQGWIKQNA